MTTSSDLLMTHKTFGPPFRSLHARMWMWIRVKYIDKLMEILFKDLAQRVRQVCASGEHTHTHTHASLSSPSTRTRPPRAAVAIAIVCVDVYTPSVCLFMIRVLRIRTVCVSQHTFTPCAYGILYAQPMHTPGACARNFHAN